MIFKKLVIENIRSYQKSQVDFPLGTSLFEGDVGSGKSTILMAMEFALFGLGNQKGDALLRKGSKTGSVILNFSVDGKDYQVKRSLIRNENNNSIRQDKGILGVNGKVVKLSPSEIKERILDILNFKEPINPRAQSVIFRYAVYTPQEEMKYILSQKPDIRLQTLRKAFGIEDYKIAVENASSISKLIKDKISFYQGQIADLNEKRENLSNLKHLLKENETNLTQYLENFKKTEEKLRNEQERIEELKNSETELKKTKAEIPHLEIQLEDKDKLISRYKNEIQDAEEENQHKLLPEIEKLEKFEKPAGVTEQNLKTKIDQVKERIKAHDGFISNLSLLNESLENTGNKLAGNKNKKLEDLQVEKVTLTEKIEEQTNLIKSHQKQLDNVTERIHKLEAQKEDINKKLENLDGLGDLCPICGSKLDEDHKQDLKNERKREFKRLNAESTVLMDVKFKGGTELENYNREQKDLEERLSDLKQVIDILNDYNSLKNKIESIEGNIRKIDGELEMVMEDNLDFDHINNYIGYLETLIDRIKEFQNAQKELENLRYYQEKNLKLINENNKALSPAKQEMHLLKEALHQARIKVSEMAGILIEIEKLRSTHQNTEKELQFHNQKIISTKTLIKSSKTDIGKVEDEITKKEGVQNQLNRLQYYHIWLNDYLIPTLGIIEKQVMQNIHQEFDENFKKWFNILMDDPSKTGKINEEFTPIIEQDGFEQEITYLSGGEKTSVALAYRLALNYLVQKVSTGMKSNLLILDEPTDGFSKEQLFKVREILNELDCPQIIMVSHERELESFADNIFQIEKIDGISEVQPAHQ
jgi:DNA repair protein SbcC/Rad50